MCSCPTRDEPLRTSAWEATRSSDTDVYKVLARPLVGIRAECHILDAFPFYNSVFHIRTKAGPVAQKRFNLL